MQSVGSSDIVQLVTQLSVNESKEHYAFLTFIKYLFEHSEVGSLEH